MKPSVWTIIRVPQSLFNVYKQQATPIAGHRPDIRFPSASCRVVSIGRLFDSQSAHISTHCLSATSYVYTLSGYDTCIGCKPSRTMSTNTYAAYYLVEKNHPSFCDQMMWLICKTKTMEQVYAIRSLALESLLQGEAMLSISPCAIQDKSVLFHMVEIITLRTGTYHRWKIGLNLLR